MDSSTVAPEEKIDHVFVIALVCFGAGAILLLVGCGIFICYCQRNKKRHELQKMRKKERQRMRHLEEYSLKTGGDPDEYLKYGTGTSWGSASLHSTDTNRNKARQQRAHQRKQQYSPQANGTAGHNGMASPTGASSNGHAFEWNDIGQQNHGYEDGDGSVSVGSLGRGEGSLGSLGGSLAGQDSVRGSDKCLTDHERQTARSSTLDRMGDVAF